MKNKENNIIQVSLEEQADPTKIILQLNETLNPKDMQESTLHLKEFETKDEELEGFFFGVLYIIHSIVDLSPIAKEYFLNTGKLVVGLVDNKETCWISFCGWYILADGMYMIRMTQIKYADFNVIEEVDIRGFYERNFIDDNSAQINNRKQQMS